MTVFAVCVLEFGGAWGGESRRAGWLKCDSDSCQPRTKFCNSHRFGLESKADWVLVSCVSLYRCWARTKRQKTDILLQVKHNHLLFNQLHYRVVFGSSTLVIYCHSLQFSLRLFWSMWDLWLTKGQWRGFFSRVVWFRLCVSIPPLLPTHWFIYQPQARSQGAASESPINLADPNKNAQNFRSTCSSASKNARHATAATCRHCWPKRLKHNPRSPFHSDGWLSKRGVRRNDYVTYVRTACCQCAACAYASRGRRAESLSLWWLSINVSCSCFTWKCWSTQEYSIPAVLERIVWCAWFWRKLSFDGEEYKSEVM